MAIAGLLAQGASGLYADEVGKLDWHQQNLGRFAAAAFDGRGGVTVVGEVSLGEREGWRCGGEGLRGGGAVLLFFAKGLSSDIRFCLEEVEAGKEQHQTNATWTSAT